MRVLVLKLVVVVVVIDNKPGNKVGQVEQHVRERNENEHDIGLFLLMSKRVHRHGPLLLSISLNLNALLKVIIKNIEQGRVVVRLIGIPFRIVAYQI